MDYNNTKAILTKDQIRYITQNIAPEECEYVAGIKSVCNDCEKRELTPEQTEDIVFVTKIIAFCDKMRVLHWAACNMSLHKAIDGFLDEIEGFKDAIAENIQSIIGQFKSHQFTALTLPVSDNPLEVINEIKICTENWLNLHKDDIVYEGCRNATSGFLEQVHKYVYLFRLCRIDDRCEF